MLSRIQKIKSAREESARKEGKKSTKCLKSSRRVGRYTSRRLKTKLRERQEKKIIRVPDHGTWPSWRMEKKRKNDKVDRRRQRMEKIGTPTDPTEVTRRERRNMTRLTDPSPVHMEETYWGSTSTVYTG